MTQMHVIPAIGHNSRLAEVEAELVLTRQQRDQMRHERDAERALRQQVEAKLTDREARLTRISKVIALDILSTRDKCIATRLITAVGDDGKIRLSQRQLSAASAIRDERTIKQSVERLERIGLIATERNKGQVNSYRLLSDEDLDKAVATYRLTTQPPPSHAGGSEVGTCHVPASHGGSFTPPPPPHEGGFHAPPAPHAPARHGGGAPKVPPRHEGGSAEPPPRHAGGQVEKPNDFSRARVPREERESKILSLSSLSEQDAARANGDETEIAPGLFRSRDTMRHAQLGWTIDLGIADQFAALKGVSKEEARTVTEMVARDWAANKFKPQSPGAMLRKALAGHFNGEQIGKVKLARASSEPGKPDFQSRMKAIIGRPK